MSLTPSRRLAWPRRPTRHRTAAEEQRIPRARVIERLAGLIAAIDRSHPVRVAIDGVSAAGKTTLADEMGRAVERRGRPAIRASIDSFHRPAAERYRRGRYSPQGYYLDAFDYPGLRAALLLPLGPGGNGRYRTAIFDPWNDAPVEQPEQAAHPKAVLLFDGVFLFRPELNDVWDFRIFVDLDVEEAMRRGSGRDQAWMGSLEIAQLRYRLRYVPGEQIYVRDIRPKQHADVIFDNRDPANPGLTIRQVRPVS